MKLSPSQLIKDYTDQLTALSHDVEKLPPGDEQLTKSQQLERAKDALLEAEIEAACGRDITTQIEKTDKLIDQILGMVLDEQ